MRITVDYRERASGLVKLLQEHFKVKVDNLPRGDFLINNRIIVERKTAQDFLISIVDLRLFNQVRRLKDSSCRTVILIEGDPFQTDLNFSREAVRGALLSIKTIWQLPIIFSSSKDETRDILVTIGHQDLKNIDVILLRSGYRPRRLRTRQLYLLQGLPGVGPVLAKRLLEHFGTPMRAMKASDVELATVKGIGSERAHVIRKILDGGEF